MNSGQQPKSVFERWWDARLKAEKGESGEKAPSELIEDKRDLAAKLERVTEKSINKKEQIIDMPLPDLNHPSFGVVLRAQNTAAGDVLNTQTKVDENRLRAEVVDKLPELLVRLKEEQIKYAQRRLEEKQQGMTEEPINYARRHQGTEGLGRTAKNE